MSFLIVCYGLTMIGSMAFRHKVGLGPTAAIFVDALWPVWVPVYFIARANGWRP